jgi:hypothetical protein
MVRVWYQACPHDASGGAGTRRPVRGTLCRTAGVAAGSHWSRGAYPGSPGWRGLGAHQGGPCPAGSRGCARVPGAPLAPSATGRGGGWPAGSAIRKLPRNIRPSRNIRATGVAQSFRGSRMFHANGNSGTGARHGTAPGPAARARGRTRPRGTHPGAHPAPRHAPGGRAPPRWTRPRAARRPHGARRTGSGSPGRPPGLRDTIYGTRSGWPHGHRPRPFSLSNAGPG